MNSGRVRRIVFALATVLLVVGFSVVAAEKKWPAAEGYWLPEGTSTYADRVDGLFYGILYLTGIVFVITEALLLLFLVKYRHQEGRRAVYTHGNHTLEMVWTLVPAVILGTIAFMQKGAWDEIKKDTPAHADVVRVQTYAQQFQWNFRYAGNDKVFGTKDDVTTAGLLVLPVNKDVVLEQTSNDVIHSFFIPYMRLKQDAVPGMQIKVWFNATKTSDAMRKTRPDYTRTKTVTNPDGTTETKTEIVKWEYEVVCAELCGNEHSQMRAICKIMEQKDYDKWLSDLSTDFKSGDEDAGPEAKKLWGRWKVDSDGKRIPAKKEPLKIVAGAQHK